MDAETAFRVIKQLHEEIVLYQSNLSEADTRAKFIDRMLTNVLGWKEEDIRREERVATDNRTRLSDYVLSLDRPVLVLEAKRQGFYFSIPKEADKRKYLLGGSNVLMNDSNCRSAILQARNYCVNLSIPFALVSNGEQYLLFRAFNFHAIPWEKDHVFIWRSLDEIIQRFTEFWNVLSRQSVREGRLQDFFAQRSASPVITLHRVLADLPRADAIIARNPLSEYFDPIISHVFKDITAPGKEELLKQCYVDSQRARTYERSLEELLSDRPPNFEIPITDVRVEKRSAAPFEEDLSEIGVRPAFGSTILVMGGVGTGKTTFLHRFTRHLAKPAFKERIIWIYVNFEKLSEEHHDILKFVYEEVLERLREYEIYNFDDFSILKQIYLQEIQILEKGPWLKIREVDPVEYERRLSSFLESKLSNLESHVQAIINYISTRLKKVFILVFDNVDQFGPDFQRRIYILAHQQAEKLACVTLLSLREETYWHTKDLGPYSAYHRYAYHIQAPRIKSVLSKRLNYAAKWVSHDSREQVTRNGIRFKVNDLSSLFKVLIESVLGGETETDSSMLLEWISAGDVRRALDFFITFLTSGHSHADMYLQAVLFGDKYRVRLHEFTKALLRGDRVLYTESASDFANVFSIDQELGSSHFARLRLLQLLDYEREKDYGAGRGYVEIDQIYSSFDSAGFNKEGLTEMANRLLAKRLLETDTRIRSSIENSKFIRINSCGFYHLKYLSRSFQYLESIIPDTGLINKAVHNKLLELQQRLIKRNYESVRSKMEDRHKLVEIFLEYLQASETEELSANERRNCHEVFKTSLVKGIKESFLKDKKEILKRITNAEKKYGKQPPYDSANTVRRVT